MALTMKLLKKNNFDEYRLYGVNQKVSSYIRTKDVNEEKLNTNLARAKREIKDVLEHNLNAESCFITLTYEENMQDYNIAYLHFKEFIRKLYNLTNVKPVYIATKELQIRGAIHYHIIFFNKEVSNLPSDTLFNVYKIDEHNKIKTYKDGRLKRKSDGLWSQGFGNKKKILERQCSDVQKIGNYFAKYIVNQIKGQLIGKNQQIYHTSRKIKRTEVKYLHEKYFQNVIIRSRITVNDKFMTKFILEKNDPLNEKLKD